MNDLRQLNRFVQTRHNNIPFKESMSLSDIEGKSLTSRDLKNPENADLMKL